MNRLFATAAAVVLGIGGPLMAQEGKPVSPAPKAPLSGPKVPDRTGKPTLVERGVDGKVRRLEEWPALAAARKLNLDAKSRASIDKLEVDQAAALDRFMSGNLGAVAAVANSFQSGDVKEGLAGLRKLRQDHPVFAEREQLAQKISALIPAAEAKELQAMVQEYWSALIQEESESAAARGEKASMGRVASAEALRLLGQDVKASYERVIGQRIRDFDALLKTLNLTAEQEGRVRKITDDAFVRAKGDAKRVNKADVFWKVWKELDAGQQEKLLEAVKAARGK